MQSDSSSLFGEIPLIPDDPIFGLSAAFKNDQSEQKVNVVIGAYRTDEGLPWVLPVVKKVNPFFLLSLSVLRALLIGRKIDRRGQES